MMTKISEFFHSPKGLEIVGYSVAVFFVLVGIGYFGLLGVYDLLIFLRSQTPISTWFGSWAVFRIITMTWPIKLGVIVLNEIRKEALKARATEKRLTNILQAIADMQKAKSASGDRMTEKVDLKLFDAITASGTKVYVGQCVSYHGKKYIIGRIFASDGERFFTLSNLKGKFPLDSIDNREIFELDKEDSHAYDQPNEL